MEMAAMVRAFADAAGPSGGFGSVAGRGAGAGVGAVPAPYPRIAAADRFRAWAAGFAALVALPFLPRSFALFQSFFNVGFLRASGFRAGLARRCPPCVAQSRSRAGAWRLPAFGLAASLARAVDLGVHTAAAAAAVEAGGAHRVLKPCAFSARLAPCYKAATVEICTTRDLDRPSVIGFFAPRILIPEWLLERLTACGTGAGGAA